jgi:hypothetical protein
MCPIYAWASWFSLWFLHYGVYLDFVRVCYEAYVIYSFLILLTKYLGGKSGALKVLRFLPPLQWPSPFCCFPKASPNRVFLRYAGKRNLTSVANTFLKSQRMGPS